MIKAILIPRSRAAALIACALAIGGCAGIGPQLFPLEPQSQHRWPDGRVDRFFDTDGDQRSDYVERLDEGGMVSLLRFDDDGDGEFDFEAPAPAFMTGDAPHLTIILDSIPFELVREYWEQGRFRCFYPPSRVISPFPVMTDMGMADFFGVAPSRAMEAQYYDGHRLNTGYGTYARQENSHWLSQVDYHLSFATHSVVYLWPKAWFDHELRRIQEKFIDYARKSGSSPTRGDATPTSRAVATSRAMATSRAVATQSPDGFVGYVVGTSALGARLGRQGHEAGLVRLDRFCQWLIHTTRGRIRITLLSDHGHNLRRSKRIDLARILTRLGYRVGRRLERPGDVVLPGFGIVTCAAIHTESPAAVSEDLSRVDGVELACYQSATGDVMVVSRDGLARIDRQGDRYRYTAEIGDPLQLDNILNELANAGEVDSQGFVSDRVWFLATAEHDYPDPLHRLWRAFHGLMEHTPDVLLSIEDGYHFGSELMSRLYPLRSAHGSLNKASSSAFVMTTTGWIDPVIRMEDLRSACRAHLQATDR